MIGQIESFDEQSQTGEIIFEAEVYRFNVDEWTAENLPKVGDSVDFVPEDDGTATNIGYVDPSIKDMTPVKSHIIAGLLGVFPPTGAFGIHRIYLGYYGIATAQVVLTVLTQGFGVMWGFMEGVLLFGGQIQKDAKGRPLK